VREKERERGRERVRARSLARSRTGTYVRTHARTHARHTYIHARSGSSSSSSSSLCGACVRVPGRRGYSYRNVNLVEPLFIECRKIHRNLATRGEGLTRPPLLAIALAGLGRRERGGNPYPPCHGGPHGGTPPLSTSRSPSPSLRLLLAFSSFCSVTSSSSFS